MYKTLFLISLVCSGCILSTVTAIQDYYWRDYVHGSVPIDAFEGKPGIYVGQAYFNNHGIIPVAIYPYRNAAVAIFGTKRNIKENIKIICARDTTKFYWEKVDFKKNDLTQMLNAIRGGFQDGQELFVGAVRHDNDWKIGKVKDLASHNDKGLYVWDNTGNHTKILEFELLKYNSTALPVINFDCNLLPVKS